MQLRKVRVREFKSIWDSNEFKVDRVACLVGKNEAGKTALLEALYRLNPVISAKGNFDVTDDYPRSEVEDYQQAVESGRREHAIVVKATFELEDFEREAIQKEYGDGVLAKPQVVVSKGYAKNESGQSVLYVDVPVDEGSLVRNLVAGFALPRPLATEAAKQSTLSKLVDLLDKSAKEKEAAVAAATAAAKDLKDDAEKAAALEESKALAESEQAKALRARLDVVVMAAHS